MNRFARVLLVLVLAIPASVAFADTASADASCTATALGPDFSRTLQMDASGTFDCTRVAAVIHITVCIQVNPQPGNSATWESVLCTSDQGTMTAGISHTTTMACSPGTNQFYRAMTLGSALDQNAQLIGLVSTTSGGRYINCTGP